MLSSFPKVVSPHDQPVREAIDYSESYISNPISDGDFRGRKMEANIRMEGGLLEGELAVFWVPFPSFLMDVTNLPHLSIMW